MPVTESSPGAARRALAKMALVVGLLAVTAAVVAWLTQASRHQADVDSSGTVVQTIRSGNLDIVLLSSSGTLRQGRGAFTVEFRRAGTNTPVDAGTVRASAAMAMPGMVMSGGLRVDATDLPGRYLVTGDFGMAGTWRMTLDWDGPAGRGSASFEGSVQ